MTYTEADFDHLSWHDCHIWAVELRPGDPDTGDWTSDLALGIDFIVEFRVAEPPGRSLNRLLPSRPGAPLRLGPPGRS